MLVIQRPKALSKEVVVTLICVNSCCGIEDECSLLVCFFVKPGGHYWGQCDHPGPIRVKKGLNTKFCTFSSPWGGRLNEN